MKTVATLVIWFLSCHSPVHAQETRPPFPWRFVKVASLQTEIPEAGISTLTSAGIDGEGNVCFTSSRILAIHQFNPNGTWKGNLGSSGSGPGEFHATHKVTLAFNGEILVYDGLSGRKLTHLNRDGEYQDSFVDLLGGRVEGFQFATSTSYWISSLTPSYIGADLYRTVKLRDRIGNVLWSLKTLVEEPYLEIATEMIVATVGPSPIGLDVLWAVDPSGVAWILTPDQGQLLRIDALGNELSSITLDLPPMSFSISEWRLHVEELVAPFFNQERPWVRDEINDLRKKLLGSRSKLRPVQRMWWAGPDGLLIDRNVYKPRTPIQDWALKPGRYAAILQDGRMSNEVAGPGGLILAVNGYALCLESRSDELPKLILYKIEPLTQ